MPKLHNLDHRSDPAIYALYVSIYVYVPYVVGELFRFRISLSLLSRLICNFFQVHLITNE